MDENDKIVDGVLMFEKAPGVWLPKYGCSQHGKAFAKIIRKYLDLIESNEELDVDALHAIADELGPIENAWYEDENSVRSDALLHNVAGFMMLPTFIQSKMMKDAMKADVDPMVKLLKMLSE